VNLGNGVVHKQPGGAICIISAHSEHRGRIFLHFADNDPKTVEIVSKVILLARDEQIKGPTILEQILECLSAFLSVMAKSIAVGIYSTSGIR